MIKTKLFLHSCLLGINVLFSIRCSSKVGKKYAEPGSQKVSIGDGCNSVGTIIHELMHAIGRFVYTCNSLDSSRQQHYNYNQFSWSLYLACVMTVNQWWLVDSRLFGVKRHIKAQLIILMNVFIHVCVFVLKGFSMNNPAEIETRLWR